MTTILMIRHGESEANRMGVFAGNLNVDLQHRGEKQAEKTAEFIANTYKVDKIYASDLKRAWKTGKTIGDRLGMGVESDPRIREINAGEWEGKTFDVLEEKYKDSYSVWKADVGNSKCPGGETVREFGARILGALTDIAELNEGKTVVVATHATPIRVMQLYATHGDFDRMKDIKWASNASVSEFIYENGKFRCGKISQDLHLGDLHTELPANV